MENIKSIRENNTALYTTLLGYHCTASYNGQILYEGQYDENYDYGTMNKSCVVLKFNIPNEKQFICLEEHNETIEQLQDLMPDFNTLFEDPKLYNKAVNMSFNLPMYCLCEDKSVLKRGDSIVKIYENLNMKQ
jgi:hypothetical protein